MSPGAGVGCWGPVGGMVAKRNPCDGFHSCCREPLPCPCPLLDGFAFAVANACDEEDPFFAIAVVSVEGRWLGGEGMLEAGLWCMSLWRGLLAVKGRPRLHWQVAGEAGAGIVRGGVVCIVI